MKKNYFPALALITMLCTMQATAQKIDLTDTRMMKQPAVSENQIAFIYAEDLWVANLLIWMAHSQKD